MKQSTVEMWRIITYFHAFSQADRINAGLRRRTFKGVLGGTTRYISGMLRARIAALPNSPLYCGSLYHPMIALRIFLKNQEVSTCPMRGFEQFQEVNRMYCEETRK